MNIKEKNLGETPHFVREFTVGHTKVKIADNYCANKTPEEVNAVLKRISKMAQDSITAAAEKQQEK